MKRKGIEAFWREGRGRGMALRLPGDNRGDELRYGGFLERGKVTGKSTETPWG